MTKLSDRFLRERYERAAEAAGVKGGQGKPDSAVVETAYGCAAMLVAAVVGAAIWALVGLFFL